MHGCDPAELGQLTATVERILPTTSAVAAWLAAAAAGSQRYAVQVFNTLERVALDWVERHVGFARHVAQLALGHPRLELLHEPELSIVCFRYTASDAVNAEILQRLRRTTRLIPSSTVVGGQLAIRPCFVNPHTQPADVNALVDHVITIGDELTGTQSG